MLFDKSEGWKTSTAEQRTDNIKTITQLSAAQYLTISSYFIFKQGCLVTLINIKISRNNLAIR